MVAPEDTLLALCIGSCRKRFQRLKPRVDVAEAVARWPELNWEAFLAQASAWDCQAMAYTGFMIARLTVGCGASEAVPADLGICRARRAVIGAFCWRATSLPLTRWKTDRSVGERESGWSIVLPHLTYRPYQMWRKGKLWLAAERD